MADPIPGAPNRVVPPSLAVAIDCYKLRRYPFEVGVDREGVKEILRCVWSQLQEPFDEAWDSDEGRGEAASGPDEDWARRLAELVTGMPYNSPGQVYLSDSLRDRHVLRWAQNDNDPAYPLMSACLQLVDLAVMFAGFTIDNSGPTFGFNQDGSQALPLSKLKVGETETPGHWDPAGADLRDAVKVLAAYPDSGPLIMYPFSDPVAGPGKGAAHIGTVGRVTAKRDRFQFIDTGGMNSPEPEQPQPRFSNGKSKIYEYQWASMANGPKHTNCDGLGVIPKSAFDQALSIGMTRMARARPLGFARFVLATNASPRRLIFATRLLPMHVPNRPEMNFSIARYIWSLRYMPCRNNLTGYWVFQAPQNDLAVEMIDPPVGPGRPAPDPPRIAGRQFLVDEIVQARYARSHANPPAVLNYQDVLATSIYATSPDVSLRGGGWAPGSTYDGGLVRGVAGWSGRNTIGAGYSWLYNLPWRTRSGEIQLEDSDFAEFPYLAGEWQG